MAFEKLRTIVITAIPKPRSREKVPQDCRNHPNSPKPALRKLYDRRSDEVPLDWVERIEI